MSITIDTVTYNLGIKVVARNPAHEYKYAERLQNGVLQAEMIGTYFNYSFEVGMSSRNVGDYAALFLKLTEPVVFHEVTVPGAPAGYETDTYYFANIKDEVIKWIEGGVVYYRNLSFTIIAKSPARTP